ncbi:hypothetical protein G7Z17_g7062 [Cylindrodendrum hubeiense]|uniref:Major facilitator superfamily (MFS) profile domain-containing protein n=1 Tax=Cylindrodendrum hubeiense TaxID=595255 RepID=A0A9P5H7T7_9HYPO|nr:hypothetical protein G7Z17_g7062 [Cylindrodendrum hubeiense]
MGQPSTNFNTLVILFATLGSITYGYCACIIATTLGQPTFRTYMKLDTASNVTQIEGAINGLFQAGGFIGTLSSSWTGDRFGRKQAIFIASCFCVVGGALQAGSAHIAMFIVARFITGLGIVPLFQSELSPPQSRGLLVGLHGVFILLGYATASWVGVGFYFVNASGAQWRPPLAFQVLPPLLLCCGILRLPESPRWLVERGHRDEALDIIKKLHHSADGDDSFANNEFAQIERQLEYEHSLPSSWSSLFTVPSYRKRAIVGFLTMFCAQCSGTQVINNYGPFLYSKLGYGPKDQLLLQAGWISWGPIGNLINALLLDKLGRKTIMAGTAVALLGEIIMLAVFGDSDNRAATSAAVFFLFLHIGFYGSCLDASTYVYASEIWPTQLRAKGCALSTSGLFVASLVLLMAAPTAFAAISWRYYLVFFSVTFVSIFIFGVFFPETKGLPLEEIAQKFGDHVEIHLIEGRAVIGDKDVIDGDAQSKEKA